MGELAKKRMAKLYFRSDSVQLAKDMAARVRSQNSECNIVDQAQFKDERDIDGAHLVLIQRSAPKAKLIADLYERYGSDGLQIVFFTDAGDVVHEYDEPEAPESGDPEPTEADPRDVVYEHAESEKSETYARPVAEDIDAGASEAPGTGGLADAS